MLVALLYGLGAHGILTLNDFKAIKGDRQMGVNTLPVLHGAANAARIACLVMAASQVGVIFLLTLSTAGRRSVRSGRASGASARSFPRRSGRVSACAARLRCAAIRRG